MADPTLNVDVKLKGDPKVKRGLKGVEKSGTKAGKAIDASFAKAALAVGAIVVVFKALTGIINKAFGAFIAEEQAIRGVNAALEATNQLTEENSLLLQANASAIQEVTTFGNEYVLDLQKQQILLGLTAQETRMFTEAALGLANVMKKDAAPIQKQLNQLLTGMIDRLPILGIEVDKTATRQERLNAINAAGAAGFRALQDETNTWDGMLIVLGNTFGDFLETVVGATGITMPALVEAIKGVNTIIKIYDQALKDSSINTENSNNETLSSFANLFKGVGLAVIGIISWVGIFIDTIGLLVVSVRQRLAQAEKTFLEIQLKFAGDDFLKAAPILRQLEKIGDGLAILDRRAEIAVGNIVAEFNTAKAAIEALDVSTEKISRAGLEGGNPFKALTKGATVAAEELDKAGKGSKKLAETINEDLLPAFESLKTNDGGLVDIVQLFRDLNAEFESTAIDTFFAKLRQEFLPALSLFPVAKDPLTTLGTPAQLKAGLRGLQTTTTDLGGGLAMDCVTMPDGTVQCGAPYTKGDKSKPADRSAQGGGGGFFQSGMGRNLIGGLATGIRGNISGGIRQIVSPLAGPFAPIVDALLRRFGKGRDGREKIGVPDVQKVEIVERQFSRMLAGTRAGLIRSGVAGITASNINTGLRVVAV